MTIKYTCTECQSVFTDHEAYCEDWRVPEKKFGCPGCKTMFKKKIAKLGLYKWASTIYSSAVIIPTLILGPRIINDSSPEALILIITLVVASTTLFFMVCKSNKKQNEIYTLNKIHS